MPQTRVLFLIILINAARVNEVLCIEGSSKPSSTASAAFANSSEVSLTTDKTRLSSTPTVVLTSVEHAGTKPAKKTTATTSPTPAVAQNSTSSSHSNVTVITNSTEKSTSDHHSQSTTQTSKNETASLQGTSQIMNVTTPTSNSTSTTQIPITSTSSSLDGNLTTVPIHDHNISNVTHHLSAHGKSTTQMSKNESSENSTTTSPSLHTSVAKTNATLSPGNSTQLPTTTLAPINSTTQTPKNDTSFGNSTNTPIIHEHTTTKVEGDTSADTNSTKVPVSTSSAQANSTISAATNGTSSTVNPAAATSTHNTSGVKQGASDGSLTTLSPITNTSPHANATTQILITGTTSKANSTTVSMHGTSVGLATTTIPTNIHGQNVSKTDHGPSNHSLNTTKLQGPTSASSTDRVTTMPNSTTRSPQSSATDPSPLNVTSTSNPINRMSSDQNTTSSANSTVLDGPIKTVKSIQVAQEDYYKSGQTVLTDVKIRQVKKSPLWVDPAATASTSSPPLLELARDTVEDHTIMKDSSETSTVPANITVTPQNASSPANTTASTPVHNSTLEANSTATVLQTSTLQPNSTMNSTTLTPPVNSTATTPNSTLQANSTAAQNSSVLTSSTVMPDHKLSNHTKSSSASSPKKSEALTESTSKTVFNFMVNTTTGAPCLLLNISIELKALYVTVDQTISEGILDVPTTAKSNGTCTEGNAQLMLTWKESEKLKVKRAVGSPNTTDHSMHNLLTLDFIKDGKIAKLDKVQAALYFDKAHFPNSTEKIITGESKSGLGLFGIEFETSAYSCNVPTAVKIGHIHVTIRTIHLIAFNSRKDLSAMKVETCEASAGVNLGAVIGGIIGVALIICVVLYIIAWRKRKSYRSSQIP